MMIRKNGQLEASLRHSGPNSGDAPRRTTSRLVALGLLAVACLDSGCVYRRLVVRSDPPGARVILDGQEVGYTPTGIPFTYYGTRRLTLVKPGFETHTELVTIPPPWYQWFPVDFVSDNFVPGHVADRHDISRQLSPQTVVPLDQLQQRADSLRSEAQGGQ
ncbi:MAG TPA: PEGA domain-containing protein [Planctomycetaceae bacterium]|jgi:hypothetical protein|nr:PEGA domain-containing protein [Planctomycetaceae bacterium]